MGNWISSTTIQLHSPNFTDHLPSFKKDNFIKMRSLSLKEKLKQALQHIFSGIKKLTSENDYSRRDFEIRAKDGARGNENF